MKSRRGGGRGYIQGNVFPYPNPQPRFLLMPVRLGALRFTSRGRMHLGDDCDLLQKIARDIECQRKESRGLRPSLLLRHHFSKRMAIITQLVKTPSVNDPLVNPPLLLTSR